MKGSIFVFARRLPTSNGVIRQALTVYADDQPSAERLVADHLSRIRQTWPRHENVYNLEPAFTIQAIALDHPKVLSSSYSR